MIEEAGTGRLKDKHLALLLWRLLSLVLAALSLALSFAM